MTADAVLPASLTTAVRLAPMQDGAMLYDAFRLSNAGPALFDTRNWIAIEQAYDSGSVLPAQVTPSQDSSIARRLFSWCRSRW